MAAILYKVVNGEVIEERVPATSVANLLKSGYLATPDFPTKEEADTNKSGKLSNQEVREAAKEAGLDNWETGRIAKLKEALGYED